MSGNAQESIRSMLRIAQCAARVVVTVIALVAVFSVPIARAQDWPSKPVRIVVPYPSGTVPDVISRVVAQQIQAPLGQPVIVDNRPGGGGVTGVLELMRSPADGYTLLTVDQGQWAIYPAMQNNVPYDAVRDFAPVSVISTTSMFYVTRAAHPARDLAEMIAAARSRPGDLRYSTFGVGSVAHLAVESLAAGLGGVKFTHVPFPGGVAALESLLRGDVDFTVLSIGLFMPHVKSGKLRPLAVATAARFKGLPSVPTVSESVAAPGYDFAAPSGWVARAGTPRPILDRMAGLVARAAQNAEVIEKISAFGLDVTPSTPEQMSELIRSDIRKMAQAVKVSGAKVE